VYQHVSVAADIRGIYADRQRITRRITRCIGYLSELRICAETCGLHIDCGSLWFHISAAYPLPIYDADIRGIYADRQRNTRHITRCIGYLSELRICALLKRADYGHVHCIYEHRLIKRFEFCFPFFPCLFSFFLLSKNMRERSAEEESIRVPDWTVYLLHSLSCYGFTINSSFVTWIGRKPWDFGDFEYIYREHQRWQHVGILLHITGIMNIISYVCFFVSIVTQGEPQSEVSVSVVVPLFFRISSSYIW